LYNNNFLAECRGRDRTGVWTQSCVLAKQVLYSLSHTSSPFCSSILKMEGLVNYLLRLASDHNLPDVTSQVARIIGMSHQPLAS
jgi:hypothetical protein